MPKVSVLMSTYNDARFLPQAIESVLGQSFGDWELLIINDASGDNTETILKNYQSKDTRINFWSNQFQKGLIANLNAAIAKAQGEFVARLDSDDAWSDKNKLQKQVDFLNSHPQVGLVGSWAQCFNEEGKKVFSITPPARDREIRNSVLIRNCFVHSSIVARKNLILQAGAYDLNETYVEDYGLWLRIGKTAELANLPEIMVNYLLSPAGITQARNLQQIQMVRRLIKNHQKDYPGFWPAWIKWNVQFLLSAVFGPGFLLRLK